MSAERRGHAWFTLREAAQSQLGQVVLSGMHPIVLYVMRKRRRTRAFEVNSRASCIDRFCAHVRYVSSSIFLRF